MVAISVKVDFDRFTRAIDDLRLKQIPYAASQALNDVAYEARQRITSAMPTIFDRPIPFTVNSIAVISARKDTLVATVFVKDQQAKYLLLEETGGTRSAAMNSRKPGAALTIPGVAAKIDAYGNLPSGYQARLKRASDADKALRIAPKKGRVAKRDKGVFYDKGQGPHGQGPGGYFQRGPGHSFHRLTGFEGTERYRPVFRFRERVAQVAAQLFRPAMMRRLREATR